VGRVIELLSPNTSPSRATDLFSPYPLFAPDDHLAADLNTANLEKKIATEAVNKVGDIYDVDELMLDGFTHLSGRCVSVRVQQGTVQLLSTTARQYHKRISWGGNKQHKDPERENTG